MTEQQIFDLIGGVSLGGGMLAVALLIVRSLPGLMEQWRRIEEVRNEGRKQAFEAQANVVLAGTKAVETAVKAMQDAQAQSREFYVTKLEDMRSGVRLLEDRVHDLEEQLEEKNRRIEELERENERLHREIDKLSQRVDKSQARKPAPKKRAA